MKKRNIVSTLTRLRRRLGTFRQNGVTKAIYLPAKVPYMDTDQSPLLKACFELCAATMWEPNRLTAEQVQSHIEELDEMTNAYYEMAQSILSQLEGLPDPERIMVSLVIYLKDSHAIPPLRGNIEWFKNSLFTLTELVNPQNAIRQSNLVFITHLRAGLTQLSQMIRTDEDLDEFSQV